jgi:hypothetical protein
MHQEKQRVMGKHERQTMSTRSVGVNLAKFAGRPELSYI